MRTVSKNPERSLEDSRLASRRRVARQPDTPLLCGGTSEGDSLLAHRRADRGDLRLPGTFQKSIAWHRNVSPTQRMAFSTTRPCLTACPVARPLSVVALWRLQINTRTGSPKLPRNTRHSLERVAVRWAQFNTNRSHQTEQQSSGVERCLVMSRKPV
jgi:hypothetical protein